MSTLLLYTCEKAVCLWLWGDDDRDASHHGLHAKHRRCTDHPCASPPPAGGLQNDTFLKAKLSKVWDEITSILFYFFLVAFLARLQLWRCHTNLKCKASVFFVFFSGAYFWRMSSAWRDFLLFARGLTWPRLSRARSLSLYEKHVLSWQFILSSHTDTEEGVFLLVSVLQRALEQFACAPRVPEATSPGEAGTSRGRARLP